MTPDEEAPEVSLDDIASAMVDDAPDIEPDEEQSQEPDEAPEVEAADEGEEETEEQQISDEEETGEADPEEDHSESEWTPPISMSADEQEKFRNLPPEAQEYLVRREQDRERHFSTKGNEMAEQRRAIEAQQAETDSMKTQLKEALSHWASSDLQMPDVALAVEDPIEYSRQLAAYNQAKEQKEKAQQELQGIQQAEQQAAEKQQREWLDAEAQKLKQLVPEFANPKTAGPTQQAIKEYAGSTWGIAPEQLSQLDALSIAVLNKARLYDATQAKAAKLKTKAKPAPKSAKPGTPKGTNTKARVIENFEKKPSVDTLAALFGGG